jgi:hypothetical protein
MSSRIFELLQAFEHYIPGNISFATYKNGELKSRTECSIFYFATHLIAGMPRIYLSGLRLLYFLTIGKGSFFLFFASWYCCITVESGDSPPIFSKHSKFATALSSSPGSVVASDWIFWSISWLEAANKDIHDMLPVSPDEAMMSKERRETTESPNAPRGTPLSNYLSPVAVAFVMGEFEVSGKEIAGTESTLLLRQRDLFVSHPRKLKVWRRVFKRWRARRLLVVHSKLCIVHSSSIASRHSQSLLVASRQSK